MKKIIAFSLAEALIVLLIVSIVLITLAPVITKKRIRRGADLNHGRWACKNMEGQLYSATAANVDAPLVSWKKGCVFPILPKDVKLLWVEVFGAGGGGARGSATPWLSKKEIYALNKPVAHEGEYDLSYYRSDYDVKSAKWKNLSEIYKPDESSKELKENCSGYSSFVQYNEKEDKINSYASCKTYTYAKDKCISTGDDLVIKASDCINSHEEEGTFCSQGADSAPPKKFHDSAYFIEKCRKEGYPNCKYQNNGVVYITMRKSCDYLGQLPSERSGSEPNGLVGTIYLKSGEYLIDEKLTGANYKGGSLGGYEYTEYKNGDNFKVYHVKTSFLGGMNVSKKLIATVYGPGAGTFVSTGYSCCSSGCVNIPGYSSTKGKTGTFCSKAGKNGSVEVDPAYSSSIDPGYTYSSSLSKIVQKFEYYNGCYGENGGHYATLVPATGGKPYDFKVGQGGRGALGDSSNKINFSAEKGSDTHFGWVSVPGAIGAKDNCVYYAPKPQQKTKNPYDATLGLGGKGGGVSFGKTPERNYSLSIEDDSSPSGRWKVQDGSSGSGGMIVVSW